MVNRVPDTAGDMEVYGGSTSTREGRKKIYVSDSIMNCNTLAHRVKDRTISRVWFNICITYQLLYLN